MDFLNILAFDETKFRLELRSCSLSELDTAQQLISQQVAEVGRALATSDPTFAEWLNLTSRLSLLERKLDLVKEVWSRRGYTKESSYFGEVALPFFAGLFGEFMRKD